MSKWFGGGESPEDNEEMFKRFTIDQNKKYGEALAIWDKRCDTSSDGTLLGHVRHPLDAGQPKCHPKG